MDSQRSACSHSAARPATQLDPVRLTEVEQNGFRVQVLEWGIHIQRNVAAIDGAELYCRDRRGRRAP